MAPDVIEKIGHAESWIDAGRGVSERDRQGEQTPEQARQAEQNPEKAPCRPFRISGTAGWSARGSLSSIGGRQEWSISKIPGKVIPGPDRAVEERRGHVNER